MVGTGCGNYESLHSPPQRESKIGVVHLHLRAYDSRNTPTMATNENLACDDLKAIDYSQKTYLTISIDAALVMRVDHKILSGKHKPRCLTLITDITHDHLIPLAI